MPKRIAELDMELKKLELVLADSQLFQRDPNQFQKTTDRFAEAFAEKSAAEDQWLELELQREELAAS